MSFSRRQVDPGDFIQGADDPRGHLVAAILGENKILLEKDAGVEGVPIEVIDEKEDIAVVIGTGPEFVVLKHLGCRQFGVQQISVRLVVEIV
jgi:hypothetical protein